VKSSLTVIGYPALAGPSKYRPGDRAKIAAFRN